MPLQNGARVDLGLTAPSAVVVGPACCWVGPWQKSPVHSCCAHPPRSQQPQWPAKSTKFLLQLVTLVHRRASSKPPQPQLLLKQVFSMAASGSRQSLRPACIRLHPAKYRILSWSCSRWQEASSIMHRQRKAAWYMLQKHDSMA